MKKISLTLLSITLAVVNSALLIGCGNDSDDTPTGTSGAAGAGATGGSGSGATGGSQGGTGGSGATGGSSTGATGGGGSTTGGSGGSVAGAGGSTGGVGGSTGGVSGSGGSTGGVGGSGGTATQSGDCSDVDPALFCPDNGSSCTELVPGGFTMCVVEPMPATQCLNPGVDECCDTSECSNGGECFEGPVVPWCGGAAPQVMNECALDQCADSSECGENNFCVPRGAFGNKVKFCAAALCQHDSDCTTNVGGICAPVNDPCCGAPRGLFCVYPDGGGCRNDADCAPGHYCEANYATGVASCVEGFAQCPAIAANGH